MISNLIRIDKRGDIFYGIKNCNPFTIKIKYFFLLVNDEKIKRELIVSPNQYGFIFNGFPLPLLLFSDTLQFTYTIEIFDDINTDIDMIYLSLLYVELSSYKFKKCLKYNVFINLSDTNNGCDICNENFPIGYYIMRPGLVRYSENIDSIINDYPPEIYKFFEYTLEMNVLHLLNNYYGNNYIFK